MIFKKLLSELNIISQCRRYNLSLWQCPYFLFLLMGIIIIISVFLTYFIGARYIQSPEIVTLIILIVTAILFVIAFVITKSFEKLAEASRIKTEFINVISHQLRAPLANLSWTLDLLASDRLKGEEERKSEYFRILKENIIRMKELISNLIIASRLESSNINFNKREIYLNELIKELILEFTPFIEASNIDLRVNFSGDLPKIWIDAEKIKLVIENLLNNAIQYMKAGGIIEIKIRKRKNHIYFEIKDNGVGIPKEDQKFIFQKFFRSENVFKYQTQGSGLGLFISRLIIERSGGKIGFKSQEGIGSTFWFILPIK